MASALLVAVIFLFFGGCSPAKKTIFDDKSFLELDVAKLCFVGDVGRITALQADIARALERENCHRIFFLGDLVYPKGIKSSDDPELQERFLNYYLPIMERNPELVMPLILGNHDHKGEPSAWRYVSRNYPQLFFPYYYYLIDYGGLCVMALDTSFYYYAENVAEAVEQTNWLMSIQSRLARCKVKVAITHHPMRGGDYPGSMDWKGAPEPLKAFLDTYVVGVVDIHLSGHVHILVDDGKDEGTRLIISGTGGENLGSDRPGFVVLNWRPQEPSKIGYYLRRIDSEVVVEGLPEEQVGKRPEDMDSEYVIDRKRVEMSFWKRFLESLK